MAGYEFEANDYAVSRTFASWGIHEGYELGAIFTPDGIVRAYMQGGGGHHSFSKLQVVFSGRQYERRFNRRLTRVGAARIATRFARETARVAA